MFARLAPIECRPQFKHFLSQIRNKFYISVILILFTMSSVINKTIISSSRGVLDSFNSTQDLLQLLNRWVGLLVKHFPVGIVRCSKNSRWSHQATWWLFLQEALVQAHNASMLVLGGFICYFAVRKMEKRLNCRIAERDK